MRAPPVLLRLLDSYGMVGVLALLCAYFALATLQEEVPSGARGGQLAAAMARQRGAAPDALLVAAEPGRDGEEFARAAVEALRPLGECEAVVGAPPDVAEALRRRAEAGRPVRLAVTTQAAGAWAVWASGASGAVQTITPPAVRRSAFLSPNNLRNVADQIAVIAIIAVGMTLVIITGGIDLSVGSLVALSAVATAWAVRALGGEHAGSLAVCAAFAAAIVLCGGVGLFSGLMITAFRIPPFIATLAMMQVAGGLAFILAQGQTIYGMPPGFDALGRGASLLGLPNAVSLMLAIYAAAHVVMARAEIGRRIYAVGGNAEAARLSGISIRRTLLLVYVLSGLAAGLGGVITASQLRAGAPTYGLMYELYVIAAVVVGGASLSGGQGRVLGTLIGALIIAVIRNGMNLTGVEAYTQKVVLGLVILGAVLLDSLKRRYWRHTASLG